MLLTLTMFNIFKAKFSYMRQKKPQFYSKLEGRRINKQI